MAELRKISRAQLLVCALVEDRYDEVGKVDGYAGVRRPLWPPAWPLWRLEPQLWLMSKRDAP